MGNCKIAGALAASVLLCAAAAASADYQLEEIGVFGPYANIYNLNCSADGSAWGFWANREGERYTVINGEERGPYVVTRCPSLRTWNTIYFSHGGESWAFWGLTSKGFYAIVNRGEYGPFDSVSDISFYKNGSCWGCIGHSKDGTYIIVDGKETGPFKRISPGHFLYFIDEHNWAIWFEKEDGWYAFINEGAYGPYIKSGTLELSLDYKHWIMTGERAEGCYLIVDGEEIGVYDECSPPAMTEDGEYWGVIVTEVGKDYTLINGVKAGPFSGDGGIAFSPQKNAPYFFITRNNGSYFTPDGEEVTGPYSCYDYNSLVFSANGESWAFKAYDLDARTVSMVVNGEVFGPYTHVISDPLLSPDGSKYAFLVPTEGGQFIVINGEETGPYANLAEVWLDEYTAKISEDGSSWATSYHRSKTPGVIGSHYLIFSSQSKLWGSYDTDNSRFRVSESFDSVWWYSEVEPKGWIGFIGGPKLGPYVSIAGYPHHPEFFQGIYALEELGTGYYKLLKYVE